MRPLSIREAPPVRGVRGVLPPALSCACYWFWTYDWHMTGTLILVLVFCLLVDVHSSNRPQGLISKFSSPHDWPRPVLVLVLLCRGHYVSPWKLKVLSINEYFFVVLSLTTNLEMSSLSALVSGDTLVLVIEMLRHRPVLFRMIFFIFRNDVTLALVLCYSWLVLGCFELISFILWHCVETMTRS